MFMYKMDKSLMQVKPFSLIVHELHVLRVEDTILLSLSLEGVIILTDLQMRYEEWKESMYHNRQTETEQRRHNEEVERLTGEQVAEQRRANQASEALTAAAQDIQQQYNLGSLELGQGQLAETKRSHLANEFITLTHNKYNDLTQRMSVANQKWSNVQNVRLQHRQQALTAWYNQERIALDTLIANANNANTKRQLRLQEKQLDEQIRQFNSTQDLREKQFAWQQVDDTVTQIRQYTETLTRGLKALEGSDYFYLHR